ncbi:MAG: hypothetical protein KGL39_23195 [Patescibacteria group bacterium]|nr:hypothetical protein [Patescibacteria group bacterium]
MKIGKKRRAEFERLFTKNVPIKEIAKRMGVTPQRVYQLRDAILRDGKKTKRIARSKILLYIPPELRDEFDKTWPKYYSSRSDAVRDILRHFIERAACDAR